MGTTHIIAIAGPSCAGKTDLARHVARLLAAAILPMDSYYLDLGSLPLDDRPKFNFDIPDTVDYPLLREHVEALAEGRTIERPVYDFTIHTRSGRFETVTPGPYLVLEGLFALYWEDIRSLLGTKVYLEAPDKVCFARREVRDIRERGRTPESVLKQYTEIVRPMAELYVLPTRRFADIVVSGEVPLAQSAAEIVARVRERSAAARASGVKP